MLPLITWFWQYRACLQPLWRPRSPVAVAALLAWALGGGGAVLPPPAHAARPAVLVRFSHVVAPDTPKGQMAQHFQQLVQQRSGGRIRVEVYPDSQLYGDDDEMEALRLGAVELLAPSLSKFGNVGMPEFEVFDLPFLFTDLAQVQRVLQGPVGQQLRQRLARQQMLGLGFMDNGFKHMSAHRPLCTPADFAGQRLRVQASRVLVAQMRAVGAEPVVLPFGDTRRALASGVVDGTENTLSNFHTQHLAQVQSHLTLTQHGYLGYAVVTHPRFWASLSPADRTLLETALAQALEQGNRRSAALDQQALQRLQHTPGLQVHTLTPAQRATLRQDAQPVYDTFRRTVGAALLQAVQQAIAEVPASGD